MRFVAQRFWLFRPLGFSCLILSCFINARLNRRGLRRRPTPEFPNQVRDSLPALLRWTSEIYLRPASHMRSQQRIQQRIQLGVRQYLPVDFVTMSHWHSREPVLHMIALSARKVVKWDGADRTIQPRETCRKSVARLTICRFKLI